MLQSLAQDFRFALRQLRRTPGFTATAVLTLALGIGANAAIFTLIHAFLLRSLPVPHPATLVRLGDTGDCCILRGAHRDGDYSLFSLDTYQQLKKSIPEVEELAAMQSGYWFNPLTVRSEGHGNLARSLARSMTGEFVSGNYFRTFGLSAANGRLFTDTDDVEGAPFVGVMSYKTWKNDYASKPNIVGSTIWINTRPVTIVGIAPEGFYGDRISSAPPAFYLPIGSMTTLANAPYVHDEDKSWLYMIGRVKPGTNLTQLQTEISSRLRQIYTSYKTFSDPVAKTYLPRTHIVLTPGGAGIKDHDDPYAAGLHLLMSISGIVLLIACANIANLLLVRGMGRSAEMSLRTALGATRRRIVRQLLTESMLLAGISGLVGVAIAGLGARLLLALAYPHAENLPVDPDPSPVVLAFALGVSLLTGILFGLAPAWITAKSDPMDALRHGTRATTGGTTLLQHGLVVTQATLSLVLLVVAGLFTQSLNKLQHIHLKLDTSNRYIVHINPQAAGYSQTQLEALYQTIEQRFHLLSGVTKVGITSYTPMEGNNNGSAVQIQGKPFNGKESSTLRVNAEYFDAVGTHVLMGRGILPTDTSASTHIAVVNQTLVKDLFAPGENPIGHHIGPTGPDSSGDFEIVGVVEDTAYTNARWKDHLMFFVPTMQRGAYAIRTQPIEKDDSLYAGALVIATDHPIGNMEALTRQTLAAINSNLTVVKFQSFRDQVSDRFQSERMLATLTGLFGALALLLATIGLYGVTAYGVARRTSEIGIRMALGAERRNVVAMVLRGTFLQTAIGLAIGLPIAWFSVRILQSQLYEITRVDSTVLLISVLSLALAAALAGFLPARRAASIEPQQALRHE